MLGFGDEIRSTERHRQGVNGRADDVGGDEDIDACSGSGSDCSTISGGVGVYRNSEGEGKNKGCLWSDVESVRLREVYGSRFEARTAALATKTSCMQSKRGQISWCLTRGG